MKTTFLSPRRLVTKYASNCDEYVHKEIPLLVHLFEGQFEAQLSGKETRRDSQKSLWGDMRSRRRIFNESLSYLCVVRGRRGIFAV